MALYPSREGGGDPPTSSAQNIARHRVLVDQRSIIDTVLQLRRRQIDVAAVVTEPEVIETDEQGVLVQYDDFVSPGTDDVEVLFDVDADERTVRAYVPAVGSSVLMAPHFATANLTTVKTITSGSSFAVYVGKAPRDITSATLRCDVTTAMTSVTWGEVALATGAINVGGNPTLTVVGYADVSASYNSTGLKSTTINVSVGQQINAGDDLWILIGNSATIAANVRAQSVADYLQVGVQASAAQRPSTIVGTPTAFTIEGATTVAAWVALVI